MTLIVLPILFNALVALTILSLALGAGRRDPSPRVRRIWLSLALLTAGLVLGGTHRLALQATRIGWLDSLAQELLLTQWQLVQSLLLGTLMVFAYVMVRRATRSIGDLEVIAGALMDRARDSHLDLDNLTNRERDVMNALAMGKLTDRELAEHLVISESTVQTYVKALLRKTGLHRRQDLVALAILRGSDGFLGRSPKEGREFPHDGETIPPSRG